MRSWNKMNYVICVYVLCNIMHVNIWLYEIICVYVIVCVYTNMIWYDMMWCDMIWYDMIISPIHLKMGRWWQKVLKHTFAVPVCSPANAVRLKIGRSCAAEKTTSKFQSWASAPSERSRMFSHPLKCLHLCLLLLVAGGRWAQASSTPHHPALESV